ncbi:Uncharacterized protein Rs2_02074 [Raphanus sativus]|nr:Uncharacterized protein Rs2_02074 [Raphanus sativus]
MPLASPCFPRAASSSRSIKPLWSSVNPSDVICPLPSNRSDSSLTSSHRDSTDLVESISNRSLHHESKHGFTCRRQIIAPPSCSALARLVVCNSNRHQPSFVPESSLGVVVVNSAHRRRFRVATSPDQAPRAPEATSECCRSGEKKSRENPMATSSYFQNKPLNFWIFTIRSQSLYNAESSNRINPCTSDCDNLAQANFIDLQNGPPPLDSSQTGHKLCNLQG